MITNAQVTNLLDEFDHEINFNDDWQFLIAYGLNGVGKTKFLELINGALNHNYEQLRRIEFASLTLTDENSRVLVFRRESDKLGNSALSCTITLGSGKTIDYDLSSDLKRRDRLRRLTPYEPLEHGFDLWHDPNDGEIVEYSELIRTFGKRIGYDSVDYDEMPEEIRDFIDENPSYLIDTQRLIAQTKSNQRSRQSRDQAPERNVDGFAEEIISRIGRELARNSLESRSLDRTFPRRIIAGLGPAPISEEMILKKYKEQEELTARLSRIGFTETQIDVPLPRQDDEMPEWQRIVLSTYLEDNAKKLGTFTDILARIDLLESLINSRFIGKHILISSDDGLIVRSNKTQKLIQPSDLSSGEQHELVLFYNLLFRVNPGVLVLIDEPEISLHVKWQKLFIGDVLKIARLSRFKFVVATHSPQIMGPWRNKSTRLGGRVK